MNPFRAHTPSGASGAPFAPPPCVTSGAAPRPLSLAPLPRFPAAGAVLAGVAAFAAVILLSSGCRDLQPAITAANTARTAGHASAAVIERVCLQGYERAAALDSTEAGREVLRLDRLGCPDAARAHEAHRVAHVAAVAVLQAIEAGTCPPGSREPACDLAAAGVRLAAAGAELTAAAARIGGGQ